MLKDMPENMEEYRRWPFTLDAKVAGLSLLDLLTEIYQHSLEVRHAD